MEKEKGEKGMMPQVRVRIYHLLALTVWLPSQNDLIVLLAGPILLLIRFSFCNARQDYAVCDVTALVRMLRFHGSPFFFLSHI